MANQTGYISANNIQQQSILILLDQFAEDLKKISGKCIDLGCGPGNITSELLLPALDPDATIIAMDISEDMIKYANENNTNKKRIKFEVLDMETKNLPEKYVSKFDYIFSFHAIHWCKDIRQAFKNMNCMLRPGGSIFILMIGYYEMMEECMKFIYQDTRAASYLKKKIWPFHFASPEVCCKDLNEILNIVGFTVQSCNLLKMPITMKEIENTISTLLCLILDNMPHDEREEIGKDLHLLYEKELIKRGGEHLRVHFNDKLHKTTVISTYEILMAKAQKALS